MKYTTTSHFNSTGKSFSFARKPREISLSSLNHPSLTGHLKTYNFTKRNAECKEEVSNNIRLFKRKQLPNSKRILNPNLLEDYPTSNRCHSLYIAKHKSCSGLLSPSNPNPVISYEEQPKEKGKRVYTNLYKSFKFAYNPNDPDDTNKPKRCSNKAKYDIYKNTTQIYELPGGVKRELPVKNRMTKLNEQSIKMKMQSDFSSKVSCLPGSMTRDVNDKYSLHKKMVSDGGIHRESTEERNEFRKSKKSAVYGRNANETFHNNTVIKEGKRTVLPNGVRDQFRSQFVLG